MSAWVELVPHHIRDTAREARFVRIAKAGLEGHIPTDCANHGARSMDIQGLGYVGVHAKSIEDWTSFGTRFLGMQLVEKNGKKLALRMDDRKQRVVIDEDGGEGVAFFGWEVSDAAKLDQFGARLEQAGVRVSRGSRALADGRRVKDLIGLADPPGNRLEIFHGAETAS